MGNKTLLVMIDDDTDEHEIFNMAIKDLKGPIQELTATMSNLGGLFVMDFPDSHQITS